MKYDFQTAFASVCENTGIKNIWVLDSDESAYFNWQDSSLPEICTLTDPEKICVAAAADGVFHDTPGVCVFPSVSVLLESLPVLHELDRDRIPFTVLCLTDDFEILPERVFLPMLRSCDFFVQILSDSSRTYHRITRALQYAVATDRVSILLVDRKLISPREKYEKCGRYRAHITNPVIVATDSEIRDLAGLLNEKKKITILCGRHCKQVIGEINTLAGLLKSPVIYQPYLRPALEGRLDYAAGIYGKWSEKSAYEAIVDSDLILLLDYSQKSFCEFADNLSIVQISPLFCNGVDKDKTKRVYNGDIRDTLLKLFPYLDRKTDDSFVRRITDMYKAEHQRLQPGQSDVPSLLFDIASVLDERLDRNSALSAEGRNAYFFQHFLLGMESRRFVYHLNEINGAGNVIFEAIGLSRGSHSIQSMAMIDAAALEQESSCLLPLINPAYKFRLMAFNTSGVREHTFLETLSKSMGFPYFKITDREQITPILDSWLYHHKSGLLEVCVDPFTDPLMTKTHPDPVLTIPERLSTTVLDSLIQLKTGPVFCGKDTFPPAVLAPETPYAGKVHPICNTRNMFYAASGAAQFTDDITVCVATSLREVLRMLSGLQEALLKQTPVLFLVFVSADTCEVHQQHQALILNRLAHFLSGYSQFADFRKDLNLVMGEAIAEARQLHSVSTIIFQEVYTEDTDARCSEVFDSPYMESEMYPSDDEIEKLADIINHASFPVIFAGDGCRGAHKEVIELVRKIKAPLAWTFKGKDIFDYDNPYPIGMVGLLSNPGLEYAFHKCDLIIVLGSRAPFDNKISKSAQIIQVDADRSTLGLPHPVNYGVAGNIRETLERLLPGLLTIGKNKWGETCKMKYLEQRRVFLHTIEEKEEKLQEIIPEGLFVRVNDYAPESAWIVADMIMPWYLTALLVESKGHRRIFATGDSNYTCDSTAFSFGAALNPEAPPIIVLCSNITFRKQMGNLQRLADMGCDVKVFVTHLWNIEPGVVYSEMLRSDRIRGMVIDSFDRLDGQVREMLETPGPAVADVMLVKTDLIHTPPLLPYLARKYGPIMRKLYTNSDKEDLLESYGQIPGGSGDDPVNIGD